IKGFAVFVSALNNFVVDVGDITDVIHLVTAMTQVTGDHIKGDHHPGMAQVAEVVHRHAAYVHADFAGHQRLESFFLPGQAVKNLQAHKLPYSCARDLSSRKPMVRLNTGLAGAWSQRSAT